MNNVVYLLAAEGGDNPGSGSFSVLLPKNYDIFWSLLCFIVILWLFWKFVLPRYTKLLEEREDRIEGGMKRAEAQQAEAKAALETVSYTHLTLPTIALLCRSRWSPYH